MRLSCGPDTSSRPVARAVRRPGSASTQTVGLGSNKLGCQTGRRMWLVPRVCSGLGCQAVLGRKRGCAWMPLPVRSSQVFRPLVAKREINARGRVLGLQGELQTRGKTNDSSNAI